MSFHCWNKEKKELEKINFITRWTVNNTEIKKYDDMDIYPNASKCPKNIFNLWIPFVMEEKIKPPFEYKQDALDFILNHIKILCNNQVDVYNYFICWIAQMIQYPEVKTIVPTLISREGSGKGTLLELFKRMFGTEKVLETSTPSRDVFGDFNGMMANRFLVNFNELSKKEMENAEGKFKALITDPTMVINNKGVNQYVIKSFHRFITTFNPDKTDPITTHNGDRRNLIIRCSDVKKGDMEYFKTMYSYLDDEDVIKTCYKYFKTIPGMDKFGDIPIPHTDYQENLKQLSVSAPELWLEHLVRENINKETVSLLGREIYSMFCDYCGENNIKYDTTPLKLGVKLSNLGIDGIQKGGHTKRGETKLFDIAKLKTYFKLGCLIELNNDDHNTSGGFEEIEFEET